MSAPKKSETSRRKRPPITDSAWFWVYLYSMAGLAGLAIMEPKFRPRQAEIERQYQGRQRAQEKKLGKEPTTPLSTKERTIVTLRPLYFTLAAGLLVAWIVVWWRHFHRPLEDEASVDDGDAT